ncbi:hypothetical protein LIPSTDRAFT_227697 [Lipomyces starkeyi NRRL Y-11557]|uniref:Uncharacterized protein n=1 Tax=Lipomyces starkeyi NRRL Y-11557 TaxID=675824 RepID=A0A1E3QAK5_LIPST|nr:hypothetical protein LIPSTDRAFT_227697 [Lipomyces starkeyi NRRL Y-11557]
MMQSLCRSEKDGERDRAEVISSQFSHTLFAVGERIQEDAKRSAQSVRTQHLKRGNELTQLKGSLCLKVIVEELDALRHIGDDDPDRIDEHNEQCGCLFFRK